MHLEGERAILERESSVCGDMESRDVKEERAEAAATKAAEELEVSRVERERERASMGEEYSSDHQQQQQRPAGVLGTILKAVHDTFDHAKDTTAGKTREAAEKTRETTDAAAHKAVETKDAAAAKTKGATQSAADKAREVKDAAAQKTSSTAQAAADKGREAKDDTAEKVRQGTEATTQKLCEYKDYAAEKAREGTDSAAEKAKEYKDYAAEKARETKESAAEKAKQAKERAEEKARRAMGYVEDKKEETKEKAGETTETAKEKARQEMEEMKLRDEDRDDLDRAKVDAAEVKEASERGKGNIFSAIGNVTGTIKEKLMGAKDAAENKQEEVRKQGAGEPVLDRDGDGVVGGAKTVLVMDKGTQFDDVAQTLREAYQVTGQNFNDVGKIGGEDAVMVGPKK